MNTHIPGAQAAPGPVLNAGTASGIGLRAIEERFGRTILEKYLPYEAVLVRKEWIVTGNIDLDGKIAKLRETVGPDNFVSVRSGGTTRLPTSMSSGQAGLSC